MQKNREYPWDPDEEELRRIGLLPKEEVTNSQRDPKLHPSNDEYPLSNPKETITLERQAMKDAIVHRGEKGYPVPNVESLNRMVHRQIDEAQYATSPRDSTSAFNAVVSWVKYVEDSQTEDDEIHIKGAGKMRDLLDAMSATKERVLREEEDAEVIEAMRVMHETKAAESDE